MITITALNILTDYQLQLYFSDGAEMVLDMKPYLRKGTLTEALLEPDFFNQVKVYDNGRGIFWPNEFDLCTDELHRQADEKNKAA